MFGVCCYMMFIVDPVMQYKPYHLSSDSSLTGLLRDSLFIKHSSSEGLFVGCSYYAEKSYDDDLTLTPVFAYSQDAQFFCMENLSRLLVSELP